MAFGLPQTSNLTAIAEASNPELISAVQGSVNNILGLSGQSIQDAYTAQAQQYSQQGTALQAQSYGAASEIAQQNAALEQAYAQVQQYQQKIQAGQTIGTEIAHTTANGFKEAGTPLMMLRSSLMQSALTQQLTGAQANITAGGYLEQAAAAQGEEAAANTASQTAGVLGQAATTGGQIASASAVSEASLLGQQLNTLLGPAIKPTSYSGPPRFPGIGQYVKDSPRVAGATQTNSSAPLQTILQTALNGLPASSGAQQSLTGVGSTIENTYGSLNTLFNVANLPLVVYEGGAPS